jgi:hypothetical protein
MNNLAESSQLHRYLKLYGALSKREQFHNNALLFYVAKFLTRPGNQAIERWIRRTFFEAY